MGAPDWDIDKADTALQTGVPIANDGVIAFTVIANASHHMFIAINSKSNAFQSFGNGTGENSMRGSTIIRVSKGDILYVGYSVHGNSSWQDITWAEDGSTDFDIKDGSNISIAGTHWLFYPLK